jgi:hypothetical protein
MQNKPHPHKDLIINWANGAVIEHRFNEDDFWEETTSPSWNPYHQYRIKPVEPPKAEWIFCDGKRPEGIPDETKVCWYGLEYSCLDYPVTIDRLDFTGEGENPIMFIKIIED